MGIAAATAGGLLFIAKLWDIFSNPLMGWLSDRTESRWGRRRPYLLLGGIVSGLAMTIFFSSALTPIAHSSVLIVLTLAMVGTGYTIFNVPYMAMPSELSDDYRERTRMMSWRVTFIGIATLIGASAQKVAELLGEGAIGYARMGVLYGALTMVFMAWPFFGTARAPDPPARRQARLLRRTAEHRVRQQAVHGAAGGQVRAAVRPVHVHGDELLHHQVRAGEGQARHLDGDVPGRQHDRAGGRRFRSGAGSR